MDRVERGLRLVANVGIVAGAAVLLFNHFDPASDREGNPVGSEPVLLTDWREDAAEGRVIGGSEGVIEIVEFMDLECPFCALFAARLDTLVSEFPGAVKLTFHHFPLPNHARAMELSIGAECAAAEGRFGDFVSVALALQRQRTSRPLSEIAAEAGVADASEFERCAQQPSSAFPRIGLGIEIGRRTGVRGTPTVWIDGSRLPRPPTLPELREIVRTKLAR